MLPPLHFDADPDPAFHFDADPHLTFHFDAHPDPTFQFDADPNPDSITHFFLDLDPPIIYGTVNRMLCTEHHKM
jgi:hypothetical protein